MAKYLVSALCAFLLTLLSVTANAQDSADESSGANASLSTEDGLVVDINIDIDLSLDEVQPWDKAMFVEISSKTNYQFGLAKPDNLGGGHAFMTTVEGKVCWSYRSGVYGPSIGHGFHFAHGSDETTGESTTASAYVFQPGLFHGHYVSDRWMIVESLSFPLIGFKPAVQFDLGASWIPLNWFAIEFGVSLGYYQTDLKVAGEDVEWFSLGPQFSVVFEPWGDYR